MFRYWRWFALILLLGASTACCPATPLGEAFSDVVDFARYDCTLVLMPAADLAPDRAVSIVLEWQESGACLHAVLTRNSLVVTTETPTDTTPVTQLTPHVTPGRPYTLIFQRRGDKLTICEDDSILFQGTATRTSGAQAGITTEAGWTVNSAMTQRLEPVYFTDDFMRTADEAGACPCTLR